MGPGFAGVLVVQAFWPGALAIAIANPRTSTAFRHKHMEGAAPMATALVPLPSFFTFPFSSQADKLESDETNEPSSHDIPTQYTREHE